MSDIDLDDLRSELDEFAPPGKKGGRSAREERIIGGFEDIQRFVEEHGRVPQHGEDRDIFERLYAVRLERLRRLDDGKELLLTLDHQGLLKADPVTSEQDVVSDEELRAELNAGDEITDLRHVRRHVEKRAAEEIANATPAADFEQFKPLFERVKSDLKAGARKALPVEKMAEVQMSNIQKGEYFIVKGQMAYVAEVGEDFRTRYDRRDSRLRVIYDNGTESNLLMRSFQRALHRDETSRLITNPDMGPLFGAAAEKDDLATGFIYVLRSKSDHPMVTANREILHKIGVTGGKVEARVSNAKLDPTFLLADVEVVATYELYNVNRIKLENLIHRVFGSAQLDIEIKDRFGNPVRPREWFLVPLFVIDEAVARIKTGTITQYCYDPGAAGLVLCRPQGQS